MNRTENKTTKYDLNENHVFNDRAFNRIDESDDSLFYSKDRFVSHLDSLALSTVEGLIGDLIVEEKPVILDLMAGWDSHIPKNILDAKVIGLGLNQNELKKNKALSEMVIHDINKSPELPFPDNTFDAVINTVSVDYMIRPFDVFGQVARVLKPGGIFIVIFSNRMFPQKAVKIWKEADEEERMILVDDYFKESGLFEKAEYFISKGRPRPEADKYAGLGIASDPVYALYAEKKGQTSKVNRKPKMVSGTKTADQRNIKDREKEVEKTMSCPHCGEKLLKWMVPDNPFCQTWDNDFMYICFNDLCSYYVRGWDLMYKQTNKMMSYRFMYNPEKKCCTLIPVPSPGALKDGIAE